MKKKIVSVVLSLTVVLGLSGCTMPWNNNNGKKEKDSINISTNSGSKSSDGDLLDDSDVNKKIDEINRYIDSYFYFDIDREKQEEALYDGIMEGLDDPYSVYYTKEEYEELMEEDSGEYVGVGAVVTQDETMRVTVVRPIPNSPAEEAGLMPEDQIVEVDGTEITDQELTLVVDMIRGEADTTAHIKVYRASEGDYLEFDIPRRVVENYSVYSEMLDDNIALIQVQQFYDNTPKEFEEAIEKAIADGAKGLIFDLRDNPGGLLNAVTEMCDYIMGEGTIVTVEDRDGRVINDYESDEEQQINMPMVVLVNGNSASASEIFTGALKDSGKATIVGTTTFGKGIVQSVIPLSDGTAIKITIAKYFTPNGSDIHTIGIEPDYVVELADGRQNAVNLPHDEDAQLDKAIEIINSKK
ncbi:MAG: S41 family peptidase [Lachnospiraceae bacterium]|nr:S41 family peptidase [Lachnospiraceae bacterium]MBR1817193.1 S41 family peptidase [Lachnospiraceae bacterium]